MRVYPDGTATVVRSVVSAADPFTPLTVKDNTDANDYTAATLAVAWANDNDWPTPDLSADGVDLRDCVQCFVCDGCACDQSLAISEEYPEGVPCCGECVAEHYETLTAERAEAGLTEGDTEAKL